MKQTWWYAGDFLVVSNYINDRRKRFGTVTSQSPGVYDFTGIVQVMESEEMK